MSRLQRYSPVFLWYFITFFAFTLRPIIHLELILCKCEVVDKVSIFSYGYSVVPALVSENLSFPVYCMIAFVENPVTAYMWICFAVLFHCIFLVLY